MARSLGQLTIDLVARVGGFVSGMSQAVRAAQDRSRRIQRTMSGLQRSIVGAFAAIGGAALIRSIVNATAKAEEAMGLLRNAVEQNGGAAGRTTQQLADMSSALQRVSTYGDETIQGAQQLLLRFQSIQGVNFDRAVQSSLDLATALGTDLKAASLLVGKALEAPQKGMTQLERSGVVLDQSQRDLIKRLVETGQQAQAQNALLNGLEQRYKGAAAAARDTFGGALAGVKNAFGDLLEAKGGLPEATDRLNELAELFADPQFVQNVNTLTSALISGFSGAASFIGKVVGGVRTLAENAAARVYGPAQDDLVRTSEAIEALRQQITEFENEKPGPIRRFFENRIDPENVGLPAGTTDIRSATLENMRKQLETLEDQYARASKAAEELFAVGNRPAGPAGPSLPPPPSEEFLKLEARLKEQIALFGQVGEAAKFAYQIQSGELDELSEKEQQRVLSLARQVDAMTVAAEVAKEQEAAQKQLTQAYESQEASLMRSIALTSEATQLEQLRYELASGALSGLSQAQKDRLDGLASEVDLMQQRTELEAQVKSVVEATLKPHEQYAKTIAELNELREESRRLLGENGLGEEAYARAVKAAQEELKKATEESNEFLLEMARNTQDILADTLFGAMEGKIDNIGKAFIQMLNQMVAQAIAADLAKRLFGDISGDSAGGGGWLDSLFSFGSRLFGRASGGPVAAGSTYRVNEISPELLSVGNRDYLMMGNQSGTVVPAGQFGRSRGAVTVNQAITVAGRVDQRTSNQMAAAAAQRQRIATARFGG